MGIVNEKFDGHMGDKELQILSLWLEAVAQHYASGSRYLDVTHSVESAAWFARKLIALRHLLFKGEGFLSSRK